MSLLARLTLGQLDRLSTSLWLVVPSSQVLRAPGKCLHLGHYLAGNMSRRSYNRRLRPPRRVDATSDWLRHPTQPGGRARDLDRETTAEMAISAATRVGLGKADDARLQLQASAFNPARDCPTGVENYGVLVLPSDRLLQQLVKRLGQPG